MICSETLVDSFLEIDLKLGDIIFYMFAIADHTLHRVREKRLFLCHC